MAKQYNPWTGFLEDAATKANDAAPVVGKKYTINGKEFKVLEVKGDNVKVLGSNGIVNNLNIKMFDSAPTIDKAIRNCDSNVKLVKTVAKKNGYAIHIVSGEYGERIVLTFPGENYNNPHMWLGSNTPSNMSKAQEMLFEFAARAKDSKCKPTIDSVIHNCDESYTVSVKELSDRDASRIIGIAQRLGFTTKDKGYTIELIGGDQNMFNKFKREVVGIRGIKFI